MENIVHPWGADDHIGMCFFRSLRKNTNAIKTAKFWEDLNKARLNKKLSFLVGNGINMHISSSIPSWNRLIKDIALHYKIDIDSYNALFPTEQYSAIVYELCEDDVRQRILDAYGDSTIKGLESDFQIYSDMFADYDVPVLSTNVDSFLHAGLNQYGFPLSQFDIETNRNYEHKSMWSINHYYAQHEIMNSASDFAIWHIHGQISHKESLRFGLIDYGKLIARINPSLDSNNLVSNCDGKTWLEPFFRNHICIVGLGLSQVEVGIRYLLLRRAQILKKKNMNKLHKCWYLYAKGYAEEDTLQFCKSLGIETIEFPCFNSLYDQLIQHSK